MSVEKGTIFAFVVPALVIILVIKAVTLDTDDYSCVHCLKLIAELVARHVPDDKC